MQMCSEEPAPSPILRREIPARLRTRKGSDLPVYFCAQKPEEDSQRGRIAMSDGRAPDQLSKDISLLKILVI